MNTPLLWQFAIRDLTEVQGMNLLQTEASPPVISDMCVTVNDIVGDDLEAAIEWMGDRPTIPK